MNKEVLYALSENIIKHEEWIDLLSIYLGRAEFAEFNMLYDSLELTPELEAINSDLIEEIERKDKIYSSGISRRYRLTDSVKKFILTKSYTDWYNYQLEDLSLIKDGVEILATITHENYVFAQMNEEERKRLNEQGYAFGELQKIGN